MRTKSLVLMMIALGCGLVASIGISQVLDRQIPILSKIETEQILVAIDQINVGEIVDAQKIKLEEWPKDKVPQGAITKLEDIQERRSKQRVFAGEPILEAKLTGEFNDAADRIKQGHRAVSVEVTAETSVSGMLQPGDRVDVLCYLKNVPGLNHPLTKTVLEDVRVFAINATMDRIVGDDAGIAQAKTVTLELKPDQVEILTLANELGKISFSIRKPGDEGQVNQDGGADVHRLLGGRYQRHGNSENDSYDVLGFLRGLGARDTQSLDLQQASADRNLAEPIHEPHPDYVDIIGPNGVVRYEIPRNGDLPRPVSSTDTADNLFADQELVPTAHDVRDNINAADSDHPDQDDFHHDNDSDLTIEADA